MTKSRLFRLTGAPAALLIFIFLVIAFAKERPYPAPRVIPSSAEQALFDATNRERASRGIPSLRWDDALASAAQAHATRMASETAISHQFPGEPALRQRTSQAGAHFSVVAENVALGPDPEIIHYDWMHSEGHRANILDVQLTATGVAVVARGKQLYAVQDFSRSVENLSLADQEKSVAALLAARGLKISNEHDEARHSCSNDPSRPNIGSLLVVRYTTSEVTKLPDHLEKSIRRGGYTKAAVAACPAGIENGFTQYRFAVLLY
jgi:uncharacterized protein YkwD